MGHERYERLYESLLNIIKISQNKGVSDPGLQSGQDIYKEMYSTLVVQRAVISLALYSLLSSNRMGIFLVFFPVYLHTVQHASEAIALTFLSAGYIGGSLIGPLAGRWSDRIGRRRPFLIGAELGAIPFYVAIPFLSGWFSSGLAFVIGTVILFLGIPALTAYVSDISGEKERGASYGTLAAARGAGAILGFLLVGFLIESFGFTLLFYFAGATMVGTVLFVLLAVPDVHVTPRTSTARLGALTPVLLFAVVVSIRTLGSGAVGSFMGLWATTLGASSFEVSIVAVAGLATTALVGIQAGRAVDRHGELTSLYLGTVISIAAFTIFLIAPIWYVLIPAQAVRQLGFAILSPAMLVWVSRIAPPDRRAEYMGVFTLVNSSMWSTGPLMGGIALQLGGPVTLFLFSIASGIGSVVAIYLFYTSYRKRPIALGTS